MAGAFRIEVLSVLLSVAVLAGVSCGAAEGTSASQQAAPLPIRVSLAVVEGRDEPVTIEATGAFQADEASDVAPEASGRVVRTPVDIGQFVREGAPLVMLQAVDATLRLEETRAAVARAEANVRFAESQHTLAQTTSRRYSALLATGDVSGTVADQASTAAETSLQSVKTARASLGEARAQLALAEQALSYVSVAAPFSGYISARQVSVGEYVQPSTPVVTLLKVDPLRLSLAIPAVQAGLVAVGQDIVAVVDAFPHRSFQGRITAINPAVDPQSRAFAVEARVPNPNAVLKPGMFAVAGVDQGSTARVMILPKSAVVEDASTNSFRVFVIDSGNRARLRIVQLAARQEQAEIRVLSGVQEGERLAVSGLGDLYDGAAVESLGAAAHAAGQ